MSTLSFLALGDSYTVGEGVPLGECFSYQLVRMLRDAQCPVAAPEIIATTGWTTGELLSAIDGYPFVPPYSLVTLCIGVNNQYRGLPIERYAAEVERLLARSIALAGAASRRVLVLSIPDYGVTPFAATLQRPQISAQVESFNDVMRGLCAGKDVSFIDITPGSRAAATDPSLLASDGLHPSGKAYTQWATSLLPHALQALARDK